MKFVHDVLSTELQVLLLLESLGSRFELESFLEKFCARYEYMTIPKLRDMIHHGVFKEQSLAVVNYDEGGHSPHFWIWMTDLGEKRLLSYRNKWKMFWAAVFVAILLIIFL